LKRVNVVIIKGDTLSLSIWRLGLVIETHPEVNGLTRVVAVRIATGAQMHRPAVKLCRLPHMWNIMQNKNVVTGQRCTDKIVSYIYLYSIQNKNTPGGGANRNSRMHHTTGPVCSAAVVAIVPSSTAFEWGPITKYHWLYSAKGVQTLFPVSLECVMWCVLILDRVIFYLFGEPNSHFYSWLINWITYCYVVVSFNYYLIN